MTAFEQPEMNQGYKIIAAETYATDNMGNQHRIVLGFMETQYGPAYVTWESGIGADGRPDYFWGHYFGDEKAARADYHRRLLSYFDR